MSLPPRVQHLYPTDITTSEKAAGFRLLEIAETARRARVKALVYHTKQFPSFRLVRMRYRVGTRQAYRVQGFGRLRSELEGMNPGWTTLAEFTQIAPNTVIANHRKAIEANSYPDFIPCEPPPDPPAEEGETQPG